jgi:hypothetical protein
MVVLPAHALARVLRGGASGFGPLLSVLLFLSNFSSKGGLAFDDARPSLAGVDGNCTAGPEPTLVSHTTLLDFGAPGVGGDDFPCRPAFGASDVIFHHGLGKLIIVSDEGGEIAVVSVDGLTVQCFSPQPDNIAGQIAR